MIFGLKMYNWIASLRSQRRLLLDVLHLLSLRRTSEQSAKGGNEEFPTVGTFMASEVKNNFSWQSSSYMFFDKNLSKETLENFFINVLIFLEQIIFTGLLRRYTPRNDN